jgi:hypothetical protein
MLMDLEMYDTLKRKFAFRAKGRSAKQKDRKVWFGDTSVHNLEHKPFKR